MLRIRMLRVFEGDCLWIDYGAPEKPHRVLIDGGPARSASLRAEIEAELARGSALHFELLVVTHIDTDHIVGIIDLLRDLPEKVTFGEIWFNTYQHLLASDQLGGLDKKIRSAIRDPRNAGIGTALESPDLLGAPDGEDLAEILSEKYPRIWNKRFPIGNAAPQLRARPIVISDTGPLPSTQLPGGAAVTLLSPGKAQLTDLAEAWRALLKGEAGHGMDELLERDDEENQAADLLGKKDKWPPKLQPLAEQTPKRDPSKNNGSSIAFLFEFEGARVLFGADAFAPVMVDSIKRLLADLGVNKPLELSAFKLSHHGSAKNLSNELLALIDCRKYLISTDGTRHHHPDHEALARILIHGGENPSLYFNANVPTTEQWDGTRVTSSWPRYSAFFPKKGDEDRGIDIEIAR